MSHPDAPLSPGASAPPSGAPTSWQPTPVQPPLIGRIWHLSDVHLHPGWLPGAADMKLKPKEVSESLFARDAYRDVKELAKQFPADVLVVSGDFVLAGAVSPKVRENAPLTEAVKAHTEAQKLREHMFGVARQIVDDLATALGIKETQRAQRVVVCPGNHDVDQIAAAVDGGHDITASLAAFAKKFDGLHRPINARPALVTDDDLRLCMLVVDTSFLGGTEFEHGGKVSSLDAPAYPLEWIQKTLDTLPNARVPTGHLGLVVAHHPPGNSGTTQVESKAVESAIAGEQAKEEFHHAGFRVVLHGHKHEPVAQHDLVHRVHDEPQRVLVLGAPSFSENGAGGVPGLLVIDYVLAPQTGDAHIVVRPYLLAASRPGEGRPWHFSVRGTEGAPAALLRVVESINEFGDAITDVTYADLVVPDSRAVPPGSARLGWRNDAGTLVHTMRRVEAVPTSQAVPPVATTGDRRAEVYPREEGRNAQGVRGVALELRVRPPQAQEEVPRTVSVLEHTAATNAYAVSAAQQRRVFGGMQALRNIGPGWESLVFTVREPVERLELTLELPFSVHSMDDVRALACRPCSTVQFEHDDRLTPLTRCQVQIFPEARRITTTIANPIVGGSYAVVWRLPLDAPEVLRLSDHARQQRRTALYHAEELRKWLLGLASAGGGPVADTLAATVEEFRRRFAAAGLVADDETLEWGLFVTDTKVFVETSNGVPPLGPIPQLLPICGTFAVPKDSTGTQPVGRWDVGRGIAGRAFATDAIENYYAPGTRGHDFSEPDPWHHPRVPIYIEEGSQRFSTLSGLPIRHPSYDGPAVLIGSFCIGSVRPNSRLVLSTRLKETAAEVAARTRAAKRRGRQDGGSDAGGLSRKPLDLAAEQLLHGAVLRALDAVAKQPGGPWEPPAPSRHRRTYGTGREHDRP